MSSGSLGERSASQRTIKKDGLILVPIRQNVVEKKAGVGGILLVT